MKYPKVSIAITTYNHSLFIMECINSCIKQDYSNFEIIIADDCSTDGTQSILKSIKKKYPDKIKLILSKFNRGIPKNQNSAQNACSGKYIAWMSGDDIMIEGKISKQVKFMEENPSCVICYHNLDVFDSESGKTLYLFNNNTNKHSGDVKTCIKHGTFNGACSNMVRTSNIPLNGFNEQIAVASDWLYWIELLENGGTINFIDEVLGRYRKHNHNITKKELYVTQNDLDHLIICQILIKKFPEMLNKIFHIYSNRLFSLRKKLNYLQAIRLSFLMRPKLKSFIAILVYFFSLGKVKL